MRLVLLGPPGAGKGTLAALLKDALGIAHISTGDILREEMKNKTSLGKKVARYIENGKLVPDAVVTQLIEQRLTRGNGSQRGYLLDGFPRTENQAKELDNILRRVNQPLDYVIYLESTLPVIIQRLTGRRVCRTCGALFHTKNRPPKKEGICDLCGGEVSQRSDDNEETIRTRLKEYLTNTRPMVDYYQARDKLKKVDADKDATEVQEILMRIFNENGKLNQR